MSNVCPSSIDPFQGQMAYDITYMNSRSTSSPATLCLGIFSQKEHYLKTFYNVNISVKVSQLPIIYLSENAKNSLRNLKYMHRFEKNVPFHYIWLKFQFRFSVTFPSIYIVSYPDAEPHNSSNIFFMVNSCHRLNANEFALASVLWKNIQSSTGPKIRNVVISTR